MNNDQNNHIEVGIIALNEEANLARLLNSIFAQDQKTYTLERVTLISDGSTDRTIKIAEDFKKDYEQKLVIVDHDKRLGKAKREDELFNRACCDILVIFDADVILNSPDTIASLIQPIQNKSATLASGRPVKTPSHTLTDHIMDVSLYLQDEIKIKYRNGHSVYACHGRIIAIHKKIYSKVRLSHIDVSDDAYLYFFNERQGDGFQYVQTATVLFKMPQTLQDYIRQQHRFSATPAELSLAFSNDILSEYKIPKLLMAAILVKSLLKYSVYAVGYAGYQITARFSNIGSHSQWTIAETTKQL